MKINYTVKDWKDVPVTEMYITHYKHMFVSHPTWYQIDPENGDIPDEDFMVKHKQDMKSAMYLDNGDVKVIWKDRGGIKDAVSIYKVTHLPKPATQRVL